VPASWMISESYDLLFEIASSKIVGFEVSPVTGKSSMYRFRVPSSSKSRVMLSGHKICPDCVAAALHSCCPPIGAYGSAPYRTACHCRVFSPANRIRQPHPVQSGCPREQCRSTCSKHPSGAQAESRARLSRMSQSSLPAVFSPTIVAGLFSFARW
jgi:hypothetical protein